MASTMQFKFTVQPDRQLRRNLRRLPQDVRRAAARKALRPGAELLVGEVKAEMAAKDIRRTGRGIESIGYTIKLEKLYKDEMQAEIGPIMPQGWYLHFIEFGTGPRKGRGMVTAKPFMEPAFNRVVGEINDLIGRTLAVEIEKAAAKR